MNEQLKKWVQTFYIIKDIQDFQRDMRDNPFYDFLDKEEIRKKQETFLIIITFKILNLTEDELKIYLEKNMKEIYNYIEDFKYEYDEDDLVFKEFVTFVKREFNGFKKLLENY